ncbi:hypothetical protein [Ensifer adhaerens]|uniref:hypothetical protein n=1 Tax=Ensifer adhaerens TaxID=106592 RepID=UPI00098FB8D0|nr:hypothetical protein [Ensifer adhaerens]
MADTAHVPRRPRYICMALNAAGRPVPMFDPFLGDEPAGEDEWQEAGAIEILLFGDRQNPRAGHRKGEGAA